MDLELLDRIRSARTATPASPISAAAPHSDATILERTGRGWDAWLTDARSALGAEAEHPAIAAWVHAQGVDGWWSQAVAVGVERLSGRRQPGQMPDGSFSISRSRASDLDRDTLRALTSELPGLATEQRSRPGAKALRLAVSDAVTGEPLGSVLFSLDAYGGRPRLTVTHDRIAGAAEAELWKDYWSGWLARLDGRG